MRSCAPTSRGVFVSGEGIVSLGIRLSCCHSVCLLSAKPRLYICRISLGTTSSAFLFIIANSNFLNWIKIDCKKAEGWLKCCTTLLICRNCLPVWWSVWRGGHAESQRHQRVCSCIGSKAVGSVIQLWPCSAGICATGMGGQSGKYNGRSAGVHQEINGMTCWFLGVWLLVVTSCQCYIVSTVWLVGSLERDCSL